MKRIFRLAVSFTLITAFSSCGDFKMRSLGKTTDIYNCHGDPDDSRTVYSPIEERLIHQGALKSRKINMESGIGMMEKTVRLFVLNGNEIRMSFHFMHPVDLEIKNFGFAIQGDTGCCSIFRSVAGRRFGKSTIKFERGDAGYRR